MKRREVPAWLVKKSRTTRIAWTKQKAIQAGVAHLSEIELAQLGRAPWDEAVKWLWDLIQTNNDSRSVPGGGYPTGCLHDS